MKTKRPTRLASIPKNGLWTRIRLYCSGRPSVCRSATLWLALSFGLASCSSANKGPEPGSDAPDAEKEIVVIDYPIPKIPRRFNPEHMMQHWSIPESVRKKTMDAYLRTYSRLSANGKDWEKYEETVSFTQRFLEKGGYYREMQKKGYMPTHCHPYEPWILFGFKYYSCICFDIYQTLQNNPAYLDGIGLKGFSRMLTYDLQYYTGCGRSLCKFPQHLLNEIGIYSMEAPPLKEGEKLSEEAKWRYQNELHRVYYTDQDKSFLFPQDHGN